MSRPTATPARPAVRPAWGALLAAGALALVGPDTAARPHFPTTLVIEPLRIHARPSTNPGYLPLVGTVPLRWKTPPAPPPTPSPAPVVLYNPPAPDSAPAADTLARPGTAVGGNLEPEKPPPLKSKDFLPFFQRERGVAPGGANPAEGLQFTPARPALPTSSADFRQQ